MTTRAASMSQFERSARRQWTGSAAHVHFGRCGHCGRTHEDVGGEQKPLLVARQPRRREFECLECWDNRQ